MKSLFHFFIILTAMILSSCQTTQDNQPISLATTQTKKTSPTAPQAPASIEVTPIETKPSTPVATETFVAYGCQEPGYPAIIQYANTDGFGDRYISRVSVASVEGKNYEEIVLVLVNQWLEHYKTASASLSASIDDYVVGNIILLDPSCDPFFKIVASVHFSVIPSQTPHDMASFPGEPINEGDIWWHLSMPVGIFIDGDYYRMRLVFGWGT